MSKSGRAGYWQSAVLNNETYLYFYNRLKLISLSMFNWENMPETVNLRFMEKQLMLNGKVVFFRDEELGYLVLDVTETGKLDVYGEHTEHYAVGANGYRFPLIENKNCVIIRNNPLSRPIENVLRMYAHRLYEIQRVIDVNIIAQKTPVLIEASSEPQKLALRNVYMQYDGNEPFIFGKKSASFDDSFKVLKTDAPYVSDKLETQKHNIWNEVLTFLGVENANTDKRERLVSAEVNGNIGDTESSRNVFLIERQKFAEKANAMFGLSISVEYRSNIQTLLNSAFVDFGLDGNEVLDE